MTFSDLPDPTTPWWVWFVVIWGALVILWACFGKPKQTRKPKRKS